LAECIAEQLTSDFGLDAAALATLTVDNCSVMTGAVGGVGAKLQRQLGLQAGSLTTVGCDLHKLNLCQLAAFNKVLGTGGMDTPCLWQLVYKLGYLWSSSAVCEGHLLAFKEQSDDFEEYKLGQAPFPKLLRWWTVANAVSYLLLHREFYINAAIFLYNQLPAKLTERKIWGQVARWLLNDEIAIHALMVEEFNNAFYRPEMAWSQEKGEVTGLTSFRLPELPLRLLHRIKLLRAMAADPDDWFPETMQALEECEDAEMELRIRLQVQQLVRLALTSTLKHAAPILLGPLLLAALADPHLSQALAAALLARDEEPDEDEEDESDGEYDSEADSDAELALAAAAADSDAVLQQAAEEADKHQGNGVQEMEIDSDDEKKDEPEEGEEEEEEEQQQQQQEEEEEEPESEATQERHRLVLKLAKAWDQGAWGESQQSHACSPPRLSSHALAGSPCTELEHAIRSALEPVVTSALFERMQAVDEFAEDLERLARGTAFDKYDTKART
jgi:hypothetical protein